MQYSPELVARALSAKRMGGPCFINVCGEGETLLTKDIDNYLKALAEEGHYIEIVTNMTVTPMIERILQWGPELLKQIEFKCSFHYLELKKRNLLPLFAENVKKAWEAGASATIEVTPSDELIPYIDEVKKFSMEHFGALPHLTIARDNRTKEIEKLTTLSDTEYANTWKTFHSPLWEYKESIFGVKQEGFCYAGIWMISVSIATGNATACYYKSIGNIFENPDNPLPEIPIGKCPIAHCFNGHAFLSFGVIPNSTEVGYGELRNRVRKDGSEWLQPELKAFFNTKLEKNNQQWSKVKQKRYLQINKRKSLRSIRGKLAEYRFYQKLHDLKVRLK